RSKKTGFIVAQTGWSRCERLHFGESETTTSEGSLIVSSIPAKKQLSDWVRYTLRDPAARRAYYASQAWQNRAQARMLLSKGLCERCHRHKAQIVHHLTYEHFGAEYIAELQALCRDCHAYLHGYSAFDPLEPKGPMQLM